MEILTGNPPVSSSLLLSVSLNSSGDPKVDCKICKFTFAIQEENNDAVKSKMQTRFERYLHKRCDKHLIHPQQICVP